jgi:hypothetical protein
MNTWAHWRKLYVLFGMLILSISLLWTVFTIGWNQTSTRAISQASLFIQPAQQQIGLGQTGNTFDIQLETTAGTPIIGYEIYLEFNPQIIDLVANQITILPPFNAPPWTEVTKRVVTVGTRKQLQLSYFTTQQYLHPGGKIPVARAVIQTKGSGTTQLTFLRNTGDPHITQVVMLGPQNILSRADPGSITVTGSAANFKTYLSSWLTNTSALDLNTDSRVNALDFAKFVFR